MRVKLESRERVGATLRAAHPFRGWADDAIQALARQSELRQYAQGEVIEERNSPATGMWIVSTGSVFTFRSTESGGYFLSGVSWPGDILGYVPAIDGLPVPNGYSARCESLLVFVPRDALLAALSDPERMRQMAVFMAIRTRVDIEIQFSARAEPLSVRLARYLAFLPRRSRSAADPAPIDLTQDEIASMLGVSRQTFNRALGPFLRGGMVVRNGKSIRVTDFKALLTVMEKFDQVPDLWRRQILSWDERLKAKAPKPQPAQTIQDAAER